MFLHSRPPFRTMLAKSRIVIPQLALVSPRRVRQPGVLRAERLRAAPAFVFLSGPLRLPRRHEVSLSRSDEIGSAHALQRLAQHRPVVGVVVAEERLVQPPYT